MMARWAISPLHRLNTLLVYLNHTSTKWGTVHIEGNTYFWSAPSQPHVISAKLLSFEEYAEDKDKANAAVLREIGQAVQSYEQLVNEVPKLIRNMIASGRRVPVYTPFYNGEKLQGYGAVGQVNLRLSVAEKFFKEDHSEFKPWMFPRFFEVWKGGKVALQQQWVLELGKSVRRTKDGSSEDYILVELSKIDFRSGKSLANRIVIIQDKPDGAGSFVAAEVQAVEWQLTNSESIGELCKL